MSKELTPERENFLREFWRQARAELIQYEETLPYPLPQEIVDACLVSESKLGKLKAKQNLNLDLLLPHYINFFSKRDPSHHVKIGDNINWHTTASCSICSRLEIAERIFLSDRTLCVGVFDGSCNIVTAIAIPESDKHHCTRSPSIYNEWLSDYNQFLNNL